MRPAGAIFTAAAIAAMGLTLGAEPSRAQSASLFTVAKISVDVTAKDAVAAKDKALAEAKQRALRTVFKRLAPYAAYDRLPVVKSEAIDDMLSTYSIRSEQNSRTRYIATIDFNFHDSAVRRQLSGSNVLFSDVQSPTVTVVPVFITDGKVDSTGRDSWRSAWLGLDLSHAVTPVKLANHGGSLDAATVSAIVAGEGDGFAKLREAQNSDRLVLAIAESKQGANRLDLKLYGVDAAGSFALAQSVPVYGGNLNEASGRAAELSLRVLENRWKVTQTISDGGGAADQQRHSVMLTVEFSSLREWQDLRSRLSKVPGVQGLEIASLSARSADVKLRYPGGAPSLAAKLPAHSMSLVDVGGGALLLRGN